ncbi:MAG TPA: DUF4476 domain-containing protein [Myxococcota bacterium]|nr:DUF4476 domain-containing protein [Myxococcota bacterium]
MLRPLSLVALLSTASMAHAEPVVIERDALRDLIDKAEDAAKRLDKELSRIPKPAQPKAAKDALADVRDRLKQLRALAMKAAPLTPSAPTPPVAKPCLATASGEVLGDDAFRSLLGQVASSRFAADKLTILAGGTRNRLVTMAQARELLGPFPFANDKFSALRELIPKLSDVTPAGREGLLEAFPLASDKERVQALFGQCQ